MSDDYKAKYEDLITAIKEGGSEGIFPMGYLTKEQRDSFKLESTDAYKAGWNDAIIDGQTLVRKLSRTAEQMDNDMRMLLASGYAWLTEDGQLQLNMNDVWAWASAWGPKVPPDQVKEVVRLFRLYGNAGLLYWHSCKNDNMRSEFHDINRAVDFVRHEEELIKAIPDSNKRAYEKATYTLGEIKN